ncbi:mechanosensitive ion channel family protein [Salinicola aestuarinus]|uniref:mechanosensitive ion channel family protein n=1 Tax=Salinicola aestuarinus TaxID=1949082 RepID=UPI000DA253E0|nr:mechanosensitive ion channel family protein [Salinicola aestuarinus]
MAPARLTTVIPVESPPLSLTALFALFCHSVKPMETPDSATQFFNALQQQFGEWLNVPGWILLPLSVLIFAAILDLVLHFTLGRLDRRLQSSPRRWDDPILHGLRLPLRWWVWLTALFVAVGTLGAHFGIGQLTSALYKVGALTTLILVAWGGVRLFRRLEQRLTFPPAQCKAKPVDRTSASALTKIVGAVLLITLTLIGLQVLGVAMSSILAMGGFGGLVIGFAARDVMANFFGGMVVHLDKPFVVGDWVRSPEREIEGMVEDIGWRLTTVRTFSGPPLYIPNAWFSQISVETPTRMVSRRLWETIGIRYEDALSLEAIVKAIRDTLLDHEEIDQDELVTVNFVTFGQYSLDIMVYAFTHETDWQRFHEIKQDILLKIRDIIHDHGAQPAIPASRLYFPDGIERRTTRDENSRRDEERADDNESSRDDHSGRGKADDTEEDGEDSRDENENAARQRHRHATGRQAADASRRSERDRQASRRGPADDDQDADA